MQKVQTGGQNPSPMVDHIRPHERVDGSNCDGERIIWPFMEKLAQLFIPESFNPAGDSELIVHFHGLPKVSEHAVCGSSNQVILTLNGWSGGSSYEKLFREGTHFLDFVHLAKEAINIHEFSSIILSGWSAGYGAIRALIQRYPDRIDGIILLDGIHTSYVPERLVLHRGGELDTSKLEPFIAFARQAIEGEKSMLVTHSSVFPGTFASTTECVDYLIYQLFLKRKAVLKQGPVGMQQVGKVASGRLKIMSFAGNTAPDHVDHLHGLKRFINELD